MRKKTLIVFMAVVSLSLSMLVGCGNQQKANNPNTDQPTTTEITTATEPTSTQTDAPATTEPPHEHSYSESVTKKATCTESGTKLEPETHWYDEYARGVWHDMGEYMFWIGNTMEEANNMATCNEALDKGAILRERYPDRKAYIGASMQGGAPTAFVSTNTDNPFWRPKFIWE